MSTVKLHRKLAIERCKLYAAQLCATAYLSKDDGPAGEPETGTLHSLIASLNRDLEMLEALGE